MVSLPRSQQIETGDSPVGERTQQIDTADSPVGERAQQIETVDSLVRGEDSADGDCR